MPRLSSSSVLQPKSTLVSTPWYLSMYGVEEPMMMTVMKTMMQVAADISCRYLEGSCVVRPTAMAPRSPANHSMCWWFLAMSGLARP